MNKEKWRINIQEEVFEYPTKEEFDSDLKSFINSKNVFGKLNNKDERY